MKNKIAPVLEALVSTMILLVVVQTFLEDFSIVAGYSAEFRTTAALAGVIFDLFFTVEFLIRLSLAASRGRTAAYFTQDRGWIDFLASVPLLIFSSGPAAYAWLFGSSSMLGLGSLLNLLKVIKAIRIARILRFLRIVKIFRSIKYAESPMAQRHVANVTALSITVLVGFLMVFSTLTTFVELPGLERRYAARPSAITRELAAVGAERGALEAAVSHIAATDDALLVVRRDGQALYSRYDNRIYASSFGSGDYAYTRSQDAAGGLLEVFYDLRPYNAHMARESLVYLAIVILLVLAFLLIYSPHFAMTITDPIHVMNRGMQDRSYNLAVKIPERYAEDDVFVLARNYNDTFLPMKDLSASHVEDSVLQMDAEDIKSLLQGSPEADDPSAG